jgi:hypothetical protein
MMLVVKGQFLTQILSLRKNFDEVEEEEAPREKHHF